MKTRILQLSMALAFLLSSYVFLSIRMTGPGMFNLLLKEPAIPEYEDFTTYGENYYNAGLISDFQEDMPQASYKFRLSDRNGPIEEADMLIFGDSQFDFSRQTTFAERVADSLNLRVFTDRYRKPYDGNVLAYLNDIGYTGNRTKYIIVESAERYVIKRTVKEYKDEGIKSKQNPFVESIRTMRHKIFNPLSNSMYNTFLKKSYLTNWIYTKLSTLRFDYFGYINGQIPQYVLDNEEGSWLFHQESCDFYSKDNLSDSLLLHCAQNAKKLQQKLKANYNLEMIYVIVPEQTTMYKVMKTDEEYHNFVPRMLDEMRNNGIPVIDVYSDFLQLDKVPYYRTDTHWNERGVEIAVGKTMEFFRQKKESQIQSESEIEEQLN